MSLVLTSATGQNQAVKDGDGVAELRGDVGALAVRGDGDREGAVEAFPVGAARAVAASVMQPSGSAFWVRAPVVGSRSKTATELLKSEAT